MRSEIPSYTAAFTLVPFGTTEFGNLVLGCIEADFWDYILVVQHLEIYKFCTSFAHVCTAVTSELQQHLVRIFVKRFDDFSQNVHNFCDCWTLFLPNYVFFTLIIMINDMKCIKMSSKCEKLFTKLH